MNPCTLLLSLLFITVATCKSISHSSYPHNGHNHQYRNHDKRHDSHTGGNHHNEHTDHHGTSHEHGGNNHQHFAGDKHGAGGGEKHNFEPYHDPLLIETKSGKVRGYSKEVLGREVHIFTGIPFAKPPIGNLRFKKPVPIGRWPGNYIDATTLPNSCYQEKYEYFPGFEGEEMWNPNTNLSEDCLYLNIWAPQRLRIRHKTGEPNSKRHLAPVLVWIYGGGYMSGTATLDIYNADIVAGTSDVIVVSIQYRVGAFGFLYLNGLLPEHFEDAPGNMGLWDQIMAFQWLRENIEYFGGNPDLITLFGESAGAASVSIHLLSPLTRHLFKRGIMQSGTLNAPWSYMTAERALEIARKLIDDVGCNATRHLEDNPERVMSCMRAVDSKTISSMQWNSYTAILGFTSAPTIDGILLPKHPLEMIEEMDKDDNLTEIIIGSNQDEGTYFLLYDFIDYFEKDGPSTLPREKFLILVNQIFKVKPDSDQASAIIHEYTDWENVMDEHMNQKLISDAVGDYFFICPTNHFAQTYASRGGKVYYYFFTQRTSTNQWGEWMGVMHGDEIEYVFGHPLNRSIEYNARERDLSLRMMQAYARFALVGKPVPDDVEWPLYTKEKPYYYIFNAEKSGTGKGPRARTCSFWNDFYPKLIPPPFDTLPSNCDLGQLTDPADDFSVLIPPLQSIASTNSTGSGSSISSHQSAVVLALCTALCLFK
uniref:Acetylcholinesterase n=1 Tax=Cacopsylla melanoneura TaxID=428564 RepID=A0A8D8LMI8_9HEMI